MKIFMLTSSLDLGGAETHIYTLVKALSDMGQQIAVGSSGGRIAQKLAESRVKSVYAVSDIHHPFLSLYYGIKLYFFIKRERFDILHGHSRPACFILNIISRLTGIPLVTTVHARFSLSPTYRRLSAWGNATIAVSEDLRGYVCENYSVDPENTHVIVNGADRENFYADEKKRVPFRIVFASRLCRDCSALAFSLCRIAPDIIEQYPSAEIVICGGGELYGDLSRAVSQMDKLVGERITLAGWTENMGEILRSAHVFIGVSRAAIEAMLCGALTILAGDEGFLGLVDSEEVFSVGAESNFCCRGQESFSDGKLFEHIRKGFEMSEDRRVEVVSMIEDRIKIRYSSERMAEETLSVYRALADRMGQHKGDRVLLCGYYGYGNIGDNALFRASVRRAYKKFVDPEISALTATPRTDRVAFSVDAVDRMNFFSIIRKLWQSDVLVFGGGTLLQDSTSLRSFLYYTSLVRLAELFGCRVELWGNGLGDIKSRFSLRILKHVLEKTDYIGLRDKRSEELALLCTTGGSGAVIVLEGDLALSQKASPDTRIDWLLRRFGMKPWSVTEAFAVIAVKGKADRDSISELESYMCELWEKGVSFLYIPMYRAEDEGESRRLCAKFGGAVASYISEGDALGLIARSRLVCAMRFHALLFAAMNDIPFVAFGKDPKVREFEGI